MPKPKKSKRKKTSFTVEFKRSSIEGISIDVIASTPDEARELAYQKLDEGDASGDWEELEFETSVNDIYPTVKVTADR